MSKASNTTMLNLRNLLYSKIKSKGMNARDLAKLVYKTKKYQKVITGLANWRMGDESLSMNTVFFIREKLENI